MAGGRNRFPPSARLRKRSDYIAVQGSGRKVHTQHFLVLVRRQEGSGRVGITVSKKVGNAVTRNRVKRLVREFVRQTRWIPEHCDLVIIAKRSAAEIDFAELSRDLQNHRNQVAGSC
jgi:ribonuclease P protein component